MKLIIGIILYSIYSLPVTGQWQLIYQTPTNEIVQVASSPDENTFWFITNFDKVYKTTNGGGSWTTIIHPAFIPSGMFALNNDTAFKTGAQSVYRTTDGGNSWTRVFLNTSTNSSPELWMKDDSEGILSFAGLLFKTTDCGITWSNSIITQPPFITLNTSGKGILYGRNNDLWACLNAHGVAHSPDFGNTWDLPLNSGASFSGPSRIFFGSHNFGIAVIHSFPFVYVTTTGASSWIPADNSLGLNEDVAINDSHCWYIPNPADHFYIKYSQDSGRTWTQQLFDASGFNVLEKSRTGNVLWAGTQTGKVYKYLDKITNISSHEINENGFILGQNYPNPFNPSTTINFSIPVSSELSLKVYDPSGKKVSTLAEGFTNAGYYSVIFTAAPDLSSGIYFYILTAGKFTVTRKLMIVK